MSAKHKSFLVQDLQLTECPPFSTDDISSYCVFKYHFSIEIEKPVYFSLKKTRFFDPEAAMYTVNPL